jgi:hypothetical protein
MRRVLHLRNVTQCAMLEDFGLFLVLAEKTLFAYHIEALVPTQPNSPLASVDPQRLNSSNNREVIFFTVGTMNNRTLVIYMKKKGVSSFILSKPGSEANARGWYSPIVYSMFWSLSQIRSVNVQRRITASGHGLGIRLGGSGRFKNSCYPQSVTTLFSSKRGSPYSAKRASRSCKLIRRFIISLYRSYVYLFDLR